MIISLFVLLVLLCNSSCRYISQKQNEARMRSTFENLCLDLTDEAAITETVCEKYTSERRLTLDFYTMFCNIMLFGYEKVSFVIFLFIAVPALVPICQYMQNKQILNEGTRESYRKSIGRLFSKCYKTVFILPIVVVMAYIVCIVYTKNFNPEYSLYYGSASWSESTMSMPLLFLTMYLLNIIIHSILYVNICIIVARKYHNYFIAVILSFLSFIGIEAFLEIGISGILFFSLLHSELGLIFNIMNPIAFSDVFGFGTCMIVPLSITIILSVIIYFCYKNKEKLIIDCERNE